VATGGRGKGAQTEQARETNSSYVVASNPARQPGSWSDWLHFPAVLQLHTKAALCVVYKCPRNNGFQVLRDRHQLLVAENSFWSLLFIFWCLYTEKMYPTWSFSGSDLTALAFSPRLHLFRVMNLNLMRQPYFYFNVSYLLPMYILPE
jgi:hypothetical protein